MQLVVKIFVFVLCMLLAGCATPRLTWQQIIDKTAQQYSHKADKRLKPYFNKAHVIYPPQKISLLIFKQERRLELWAFDGYCWRFIKAYPVLAASGHPGPKLHEGDWQVPEGVYKIDSINPRSHYHLSLDLNYPNDFDREHAALDHRSHLGENIFIHGNHVSIGCIAIGNTAIEELFVLVYKVGLDNASVIIAPDDLRYKPSLSVSHAPLWLPQLYQQLRFALLPYEEQG